MREMLGEQQYAAGKYEEGAKMFEELTLGEDFVEFLTLPGVRLPDRARTPLKRGRPTRLPLLLFNKPYGVVCQFSVHPTRPTLKQFIALETYIRPAVWTGTAKVWSC